MDCSDIRQKLSEHIEGNSSPEQQALVKEHLQSCKQCTLYAAEIQRTLETLKGLEEIEPPAWLTAKVMKKIRAEAPLKKGWRELLFFPLYIKLPIETFAALLITVATIFIYKNMGPELQQMEIQVQTPVMKSIPAEPEKDMQGKVIQKKEMQQPQRLQEEAKQKDSLLSTETRDLAPLKEEKPVGRSAPAPLIAPTMPAPSSSFAPSPALSPAMRQTETGKASGMTARDEMMQKAVPAAPVSELSAEKQAVAQTALTVTVETLDVAKKEIEIYLARVNGEFKTIEQSESHIVISVKLAPTKTAKFLEFVSSLGRIKEDQRFLSMKSGSFTLVIEKQ